MDSFHGTQIYLRYVHDKENVMTMPRFGTDGFDMARPETAAGIETDNEPDFYERDSVGASEEATGRDAKLRSGMDEHSRGRGGVNNASTAAGGTLPVLRARRASQRSQRADVRAPVLFV